ncbi:hypothetical protein [Devosia sp.]|uniref:hypothetical protein n=1 Tax=Devosia sp. TaxID=1871048 RepID=UPI003267879C
MLISIGSLNGNNKGVVAGHEFGHGQGLPDEVNTKGRLMYYTASSNSLRVSSDECDAYLQGQIFPVFDGNETPDMMQLSQQIPLAQRLAQEPSGMPVEELLSSYWHEVPEADIAALKPADLDKVRELLSGEPNQYWQNGVTVLGLAGSGEDSALLQQIVDRSAAASEHDIATGNVAWLDIQANSQLALGLLYNRTGDVSALENIYGAMIAPEATSAGRSADVLRQNDLARNAAYAFQAAGTEAAAVYPDALLQSEISALVRNGVATENMPVNALDIQSDIIGLDTGIKATDTLSEALRKLDLSRRGSTNSLFQPQSSYVDLLKSGISVPGPDNAETIQNTYDNIRNFDAMTQLAPQ